MLNSAADSNLGKFMTRDFSYIQDEMKQNGFVKLTGLIDTPTLSDFTQSPLYQLEQDPCFHPLNMRCRYSIEPQSGKSVLDAIDPITDISEEARKVAFSDGILKALRVIFSDEPVLFKDKYFLRKSGAPGYPPHQDFISWPFFPKSFMTALVALDSMTEFNGALSFYKGSHLQGLLTPADGDFHSISTSKLECYEKLTMELQPGDVVIFNSFVVHESQTNLSLESRRSLYLSYNAQIDGGDQRESHYRYFHSWIRRRFGEYGDDRLYFE